MYRFLRPIAKFFIKIFYSLNINGSFENLDDNYIICANHGSALDPIFLAVTFDEPINFMGKKELFKGPLLDKFFKSLNVFPVDRQGNDIKALKEGVRRLKDGKILGIFIEGTRVEGYDPANAKAGPILIANLANKKILPVKIDTSYRIFSKVDISIREPFTIDKAFLKENKDTGYQALAEEVLYKIYKGDEN